MLKVGDQAPPFSLTRLDGSGFAFPSAPGPPVLLVFFETDCPTCRLTIPYLNRLARELGNVVGISQDERHPTIELAEALPISFPVALDHDLEVSRLYGPVAVPTLFLIDGEGKIVETEIGFEKEALNSIAKKMAASLGREPLIIAEPFDGAPESKPGCSSRHLEAPIEGGLASAVNPYLKRGARA